MRPTLQTMAARYPGSTVQLVEDPPGPPVRATVLAEIYGKDLQQLRALSEQVKAAFRQTRDMVEVTDSEAQDVIQYRLTVDREKAALSGLSVAEVAVALRRLIDDCGLTHEVAAAAIGKSRAAVSNLLRLIDLDPGVQALVRNGLLALGHAKVLMGATPSRQAELAKQVVERELTVRQTEALLMASSRPAAPAPTPLPPSPIAAEISERIGVPVQLTQSPKGKGKLVISFDNNAQLQDRKSVV